MPATITSPSALMRRGWFDVTCPTGRHVSAIRGRADAEAQLRAYRDAGCPSCRPVPAPEADPEPTLSELFASPAMLGGVSKFARAG